MGFILKFKTLTVFYIVLTVFLIGILQSPFLSNFDYEFFFILNIFLSFQIIILYFKRPLNWIAPHLAISFVIAVLTSYIFTIFSGPVCSLKDSLYWLLFQSFCTCLCNLALFYSIRYFIPKKTVLQITAHIIALILLSCPTLYDLIFSPQLYFYHPLFGYYHGPIYDDFIPKAHSFIRFRVWTSALSLWCLALYSSAWIDLLKKPLKRCFIVLTIVFLCVPWALRNELKWSHRFTDIKKVLNQHITLGAVTLYFTPSTYTPKQARQLLTSLHFEHQYLTHILGLKTVKHQHVDVYIYPNAYIKKELIGSGYTLIGNAFQHSIHALPMSPSNSIFRHEMTHILMRPYGFYGLSKSPALLEGYATALEYERHGLSVHEWSKVIHEKKLLPNLKSLFSPKNFWSYNSYLSYLYTGSFVDWLFQHYPKAAVLQSYASGNFKLNLHVDIDALESQWLNFLKTIPLSTYTKEKALAYLTQKPITEKKCPHQVACLQKQLQACSDLNCQIQFRQDLIEQSQNTALYERLKLIENYFAIGNEISAQTEIKSLAYEKLNLLQSQKYDLLHIDDLIMQTKIDSAANAIAELKHSTQDIDLQLKLNFRQNNLIHALDLSRWLKNRYQNNPIDNYKALSVTPLFQLQWMFQDQAYKNLLEFYKKFPQTWLLSLSVHEKIYLFKMLALSHENLMHWSDAQIYYEKLLSLSQSQGEIFFYSHQIKRMQHLLRYMQ